MVAAHYLAGELASSEGAFFTIFDGVKYFDWGLTADAVLGLDAAGAGQNQAAASTALLATNVRSYATGVDWGAPDDVSAGSTAKLLNVAVAQNVDPTAFGGFDLVATLQGLLGPDGLFLDRGAANYTNTIGQSLAIIGLERTNAGAAAIAPSAAVAGLRSLQCTDGGFRLYYPTAQDTGCTSDPDATAYAVQALVTVAGSGDADAQDALDYLVGRQGANGGVGGSGPTAAANANSTGLAGQAFLAGGRTANARLAASFIRALQYGCSFPAALRGGIAYDRVAHDTQVDAGQDAVPADQDRRSTAQAILALAGTPLGVVSAAGADATAPALACAAAPSTTTSTTSTTTTTSAAPGTSGSGDPVDPAAPAAAATPGSLAFTGAQVAATVALAFALLLVGAGALVIARRKGAHA